MKILVIIVTYNASKWIDKCFGSLLNSTLDSEILVVDNGSTDDTIKLISAKYPKVRLHESKDNLGFGKANNIGLKIAAKEDVDYVLLLNQDAWIETNTVEKLISLCQKDSSFGIAVPLQFNGKGTLLDEQFQNYTINTCGPLITDLLTNGKKREYYEVEFANAACWLMPIKTIKQIGGFDPLFTHYREDDDYINRLKYNGLKVVLNPETICFHDREGRQPTTDLNKMANLAYVTYLLNLKKKDLPVYSKGHYLKKYVLNKILQFLSPNSKNYKADCMGLKQIIGKYDKIISHIHKEKTESFLYLD